MKLLLYGEIGYDILSKEVVSWLDDYRNEEIEMHINSPGGDVFEALAIRSAVLQCKDLTIVVDAMAASAAAVISLCGKPLKMAEYSRLMLHSASTYAHGNSKQMQENIENLQSIDKDLAGMIAGKMGKTQDEILATYFDGNDHWLTAEECVNMGIAELVKGNDEEGKSDKPKNKVKLVWDCINGHKQANKIKVNDMDLTKLQTVAAFKDCATEEQVIEKAKNQSEELDKVKAENADKDAKIADLDKQIAELGNKVAEFEKAKQEAQDKADNQKIEDAISEGKMTKESAETFRALLKTDRDNALKLIDTLKAPEKQGSVNDYIKGEGEHKSNGFFAEAMAEIAKRK